MDNQIAQQKLALDQQRLELDTRESAAEIQIKAAQVDSKNTKDKRDADTAEQDIVAKGIIERLDRQNGAKE